ncbi:hypothetical protein ES702_01190 [subsurface metagenome]
MNSQQIIKKFAKDNEGQEITKHEGNFSLLVWGTAPYLLYSPIFSKYYSEDFGSLALLIGEKKGVGFFNFDNYRKSTEVTLKKYLQDKEKFSEVKDFEELDREINKFYNSFHPTTLKEMSNEKLEKVIIKAFELMRDWQVISLFCEALDEEIVQRYFDELSDKKTDFKKFFDATSSIDFESFIFKSNKCLLSLKKNTNLYDVQWVLGSYLMTPPLKDSKRLIENMINDHGGIEKLKKEQEKIQEETEENKNKSNKFKDKLSGKLRDLFDFVKLTIYLRDTRKESAFKAITISSNLIREMFSRLGLSQDDIIYSFFEDFIDKSYKKKGYKDIIGKRKQGFIIYYSKKGIETAYINFEEGGKKLFKIMDGLLEDIKEIKGTTGCKGHVKAKARIVLSKKDFSKFRQGEILVTSMTRPEFVPLMKKASAVITDEGGITCHAAIVSRELNIPCIIGTKRATRVLKDEDEIEVDADKGEVKILKRQNETRSNYKICKKR